MLHPTAAVKGVGRRGLPRGSELWPLGHRVSTEALPGHLSLALALACNSYPRILILLPKTQKLTYIHFSLIEIPVLLFHVGNYYDLQEFTPSSHHCCMYITAEHLIHNRNGSDP